MWEKKNMIMTQEGLILLILNENLPGKHGGHLDQGTLTLQEQVLKNSCYEMADVYFPNNFTYFSYFCFNADQTDFKMPL